MPAERALHPTEGAKEPESGPSGVEMPADRAERPTSRAPADQTPIGRASVRRRAAVMPLPPRGVAVLRFDRRAYSDDRDVPLALQAKDALGMLHELRQSPGVGNAPLGLWGFSQGAWAAPLAASLTPDAVAFLALSLAFVSPALVSSSCGGRGAVSGVWSRGLRVERVV